LGWGCKFRPKTKAQPEAWHSPSSSNFGDALEAHRLRMGNPGTAEGCRHSSRLGLTASVESRQSRPARNHFRRSSQCAICRKQEDEHKPEGHVYKRDEHSQRATGWHSRSPWLATNFMPWAWTIKPSKRFCGTPTSHYAEYLYQSVSESQVSAIGFTQRKDSSNLQRPIATKPTAPDFSNLRLTSLCF